MQKFTFSKYILLRGQKHLHTHSKCHFNYLFTFTLGDLIFLCNSRDFNTKGFLILIIDYIYYSQIKYKEGYIGFIWTQGTVSSRH